MSITDPQIYLSRPGSTVRPPAIAGTFYPAAEQELRNTVRELLAKPASVGKAPKAIIAPHAGYIYSGATAAQAYASLSSRRQQVKRVVLLGPAHRVYLKGLALPTVSEFATPLGTIPLDQPAMARISTLAQVHSRDDVHQHEHSLEIHLPFLQETLQDFSLVPLVVGEASAGEVAEVMEILWGTDETLIIVSSDLSHFHDYATARQLDASTSERIENLEFEKIQPEMACGARPLQGLLYLARQSGMHIERLGLCNSGDTAGAQDRVVGYGAWALYEDDKQLDRAQGETLLQVCRQSIEQGFTSQQALRVDARRYTPALRRKAATFVTLKKEGRLRGCIGSMQATTELVNSVADSAFKAAFRDPRFTPLGKEDYDGLAISISVLSAQEPLEFDDEADLATKLQPGIDGLTIRKGRRSATFLPSVWENLPHRDKFLQQLKHKAGIGPDEQVERAWRYTAQSFP